MFQSLPLKKIRPRIYTNNHDFRISVGTRYFSCIIIYLFFRTSKFLLHLTALSKEPSLKRHPLIVVVQPPYLLLLLDVQCMTKSLLIEHCHD
jgi:hypothetical protein